MPENGNKLKRKYDFNISHQTITMNHIKNETTDNNFAKNIKTNLRATYKALKGIKNDEIIAPLFPVVLTFFFHLRPIYLPVDIASEVVAKYGSD